MAAMHAFSTAADSGGLAAASGPASGSQYDIPLSHATPPQPQHSSLPASHAQTPQSQPQQQQQQQNYQHQHQQQQQEQQQQQQQQHLQQQQQRSVKRPRPVKSCTECRKRKLRCDRLLPCSQCQKSNRGCKYAAENDSNLSDGSETESVEPTRINKRSCVPGSSGPAGMSGSESAAVAPRNGDGAGVPLLEELSSRMERLEKSLLTRSPAAADLSPSRALAAAPVTIRGVSVKRGAQRTRYFGQNSPRVMLNLFEDARAFLTQPHNIGGTRDILSSFKALHNWLQEDYHSSLAPITVFVDSMMPIQKRMTDILPKKPVCDKLVAYYIDTSETLYRILHMPTFSEQYNLYWEGKLQSECFLPQLLAVLSIASRFETKSRGLGHERAEGVHIPTACALVRIWLDSLKGKQLVEMSTLQVEVLLVHAQRMITPRTQDSWTQLGFIVRLAMTMGLHRDPAEFEPRVPVFIGELRRRLWFTVLDMDLHMSLACSLPCQIREGDFSCRPPRNLDDADLFPSMTELPPTKPIDEMTDNQMQVYAAMTLGVRMKVANLVNRVDLIRDYQEVIDVGAKLERYLEDINHIFPRHGVLNDTQKSKQWRSRVMLDMHVRRTLLALYRPLAMGASETPGQISRAYLRSSMVILKYLDELNPLLPHFEDVVRMYHQILKVDIIQAALGVCYFIQSAVRPSTEGLVEGQQALRMSPDSVDDFPSYAPDNLMLWSPVRLISTVQKSIDMLMRHVSGHDCKDIVPLIVVLESSKRSNPRPEEIAHGLYSALDSCLRASNLTLDKLHASIPPPPMEGYQTDPYKAHGRMPFAQQSQRENNTMPNPGNDFGGWIMWDGWE